MDATDSHMTEMDETHMSTVWLDPVRKRNNYTPQISEKKVFGQPKKVFSQPKKGFSQMTATQVGVIALAAGLAKGLAMGKVLS